MHTYPIDRIYVDYSLDTKFFSIYYKSISERREMKLKVMLILVSFLLEIKDFFSCYQFVCLFEASLDCPEALL